MSLLTRTCKAAVAEKATQGRRSRVLKLRGAIHVIGFQYLLAVNADFHFVLTQIT